MGNGKEFVYFKSNVGYTVAVRRNNIDTLGFVLNKANTFIAVDVDDLRDFKLANKKFILDGIIVPTETPSTDWDTPNALSDAEILSIIQNHLKLKSVLQTIDSVPVVQKFLNAARDTDKSQKIKKLITNRLEELGEETEEPTPSDMKGAY